MSGFDHGSKMAGLLGGDDDTNQPTTKRTKGSNADNSMRTLSVEDLKDLGGGDHTCTEEIHVNNDCFELYKEMQKNRRWFHQNPEIAFEEVETASYIVASLKSIGIEDKDIWTEIGVTGVVAMIYGGKKGESTCIMLRADMDALSIQESSSVDYASKNSDRMHACGHDGHMSALLGAAKVCFNNKNKFHGCIKLCFQPAEEGRHGAPAMIKDGILEGQAAGLRCGGPRVDACYGIHLWSFERLGGIQCSEGPVMAASDRFTIEVKGKGGHGAVPHQSKDAIVAAASVVTSLQSIVSRNVDPLEAGVVTCGTINGGFGYNIIADKVTITGTARAFSKNTQEIIKSRMGAICCGLQEAYGGSNTLDYEYGYPPTVNAYPDCVKNVQRTGDKVVGPKRSSLPQKTMGAEDFSYFLEERPGCFFFVGAAKRGEILPHHKSVFDFDERALLISSSMFVELVYDLLS